MMMTHDEFELKFRRAMDAGGHSYDPYDIHACWLDYQSGKHTFEELVGS